MSQRARVDAAFAAFCARHAAPAMPLNEEGGLCLRLGNGREVFLLLDSDEERLFACIELCKVPDDPNLRLALLETILQLNFLQQTTGPAVLALRNRGIFCQMELPAAELDVDLLEAGLATAYAQSEAVGEAIELARNLLTAALAGPAA